MDGIRARTGGDRILVVEPGLRFVPGELPDEFETAVAHADGAPDVEQYFVEGRVEVSISDRFFWNTGTSWDRAERPRWQARQRDEEYETAAAGGTVLDLGTVESARPGWTRSSGPRS